MRIFGKRAQSTAEYAIIIALVIGAAVAMQTYMKRSMQTGVKFAVDKMRSNDSGTGQYEPYYLESEYNTTVGGYENIETTAVGGAVNRTMGEKGTNRTGYQKIKDVSEANY